jgi:hypothetical protein
VNSLVGAKEYHEYETKVVHQFEIGSGINQLNVMKGEFGSYTGPVGPAAMNFTGNVLIIADALNGRIVELDEKFQFRKTTKINTEITLGHIYKGDNHYIFYYEIEILTAFNQHGDTLFNFNINNGNDPVFKAGSATLGALHIQDDFFIVKDTTSGRFIHIDNYLSENIKVNSYSDIEGAQLMVENIRKKNPGTEIEIDGRNRILINDELSTLNYEEYYNYWTSIHKQTLVKNPNALDFSLREYSFLKNQPFFIGKDKENNTYWAYPQGLTLVFDTNGFLLDIFIPGSITSMIFPAVHPSGDVYFMEWDKEYVSLYKVDRRWG